jgi:uncharacterized repeat protein (TIGR01451 family)
MGSDVVRLDRCTGVFRSASNASAVAMSFPARVKRNMEMKGVIMKKQRIQLTVLAGAIVALAAIVGCSSVQERHIVQRTDQNRPSMTQTSEGYDTYGRMWVREEVPPEPAPVPAPTGIVVLEKRVPGAVALGEEFPAELIVTARENAGGVLVTDQIPEGAEYLRSDPDAARDGNLLTWKFASMQKGEVKNIRSYYKATKEGQLNSCYSVAALPRSCVSTFVGKPALGLTKTGPQTAQLGSDVAYTNTVSNTGTMPARDVVLTDKIPDGLVHPSGEYELTFKIGELAPNESKVFPVVLKAMKRGNVCNSSTVASANAGQVTSEACTLVQQPGLAVFKSGDPEQYLTRRAGYTIVVTNTGDTVLKNVAVTDTAPEPTSFVSADGAAIDQQTATWLVAELRPGQAKTFRAVLTSKVAGTHRNEVAATAMGMREVAQAPTIWRGLAALLIEAVDDNDPVQIGDSTTYTIRVTNQGTADETNIGLTMKFTGQVKPISAEGLTVNGQEMSISTIPKLAPKESATFKVTVQGVRAGDARLKVSLTSDGLTSPVTEEESTRVY